MGPSCWPVSSTATLRFREAFRLFAPLSDFVGCSLRMLTWPQARGYGKEVRLPVQDRIRRHSGIDVATRPCPPAHRLPPTWFVGEGQEPALGDHALGSRGDPQSTQAIACQSMLANPQFPVSGNISARLRHVAPEMNAGPDPRLSELLRPARRSPPAPRLSARAARMAGPKESPPGGLAPPPCAR
jgi:hypothetical protein